MTMGMFDTIHVHLPLPLTSDMEEHRTALQAADYQIKDLHCVLDVYELRANATLWRRVTSPDAEESLGSAFWEPALDVLGWVGFYTSVGKEGSGWVDWRAAFVDGRLHRPIELLKWRPVDPVAEAERAARRDALFHR